MSALAATPQADRSKSALGCANGWDIAGSLCQLEELSKDGPRAQRHRRTIRATPPGTFMENAAAIKLMSRPPTPARCWRNRKVPSEVAQANQGRKSAIDPGRRGMRDISSVNASASGEEISGWMKTVGGMCKLRHRGLPLVGWMFTFRQPPIIWCESGIWPVRFPEPMHEYSLPRIADLQATPAAVRCLSVSLSWRTSGDSLWKASHG